MNSLRRELLKILGLTGATLPLIGCERLISNVTQQMGESIPASLRVDMVSSISLSGTAAAAGFHRSDEPKSP